MGNTSSEKKNIQNSERIKKSLINMEKLINNIDSVDELSDIVSYLEGTRKQIIQDEGVYFDHKRQAIYSKSETYTHKFILYLLAEINRLITLANSKRGKSDNKIEQPDKKLEQSDNKMEQIGLGSCDIDTINSELSKVNTIINKSNNLYVLIKLGGFLNKIKHELVSIKDDLSERQYNTMVYQFNTIRDKLVAKTNYVRSKQSSNKKNHK